MVGTVTTGGGSGCELVSDVAPEDSGELLVLVSPELSLFPGGSELSDIVAIELAPGGEFSEPFELSSIGICVELSTYDTDASALSPLSSAVLPLHPAQSVIERAAAKAASFFIRSGIFPEFTIFIINDPFRKTMTEACN